MSSNNLTLENKVRRRELDNGQVEEIHLLPKSEYYASLRMLSNTSMSRNSTMSKSLSNSTLSQRYGNVSKTGSPSVYKPTGKMEKSTIILLDGTEEIFEIDSGSLGHHLFDRVCDHLELNERQYFGMKYSDKSLRIWFWLNMDKKISDQLGKNPWNLDFQVKFYPPHVDDFEEDLTKYFFCLQVRQDMVEGILPMSFNIYVLLGAHAVQSEAGDYNSKSHAGIEYIKTMPFAPKPLQTEELLLRISELHKQVNLQSPEEADRSFLWNAMKLGMYGVDMHKVKNSDNEEMSVGVYHSGILIYKGRIRVIRHSWPKILKLTYKNKSFFIFLRPTEINRKERVLEYKCGNHKLAKRLWKACVDHHRFFRMVDAENPRKPQLRPGFGTRKYLYPSSPSPSAFESNSSNPNIILSRPQPKVKRMQTQRKERETPLSPSGIAPVASNDEIFNLEDPNSATIERPELPDEYWQMSMDDSTPEIGMDPLGLDVAASEGSGWQGSRSNKGIKGPGKYYYEGKIVEDGLIRLGWATNEASLDLGSDKEGFGYGDGQNNKSKEKGFKRNCGTEKEYGQPVRKGDTIGCFIDFDNGKIQWSKNGEIFEPAFKIPEELKDEAFFPTSSIKDGRVFFNFGDQPLSHLPKRDWIPVSQAPSNSIVPNEHIGWRMNPFDATSGAEVSGNGYTVQSRLDDEWHGCRANKGVYDAGKYYYEVIPLEDGLARVGWATDDGSLNLGSDSSGFGYGADDEGFGINGNQGKKMNSAEIENYGDPFMKGDVIGCFLDLDNKNIKWSKNGQVYKEAYLIPDDLVELRAFYPTSSLLNNTLDFNFGNRPFEFYPGSEWNGMCYAANGNTEKSKKRDPLLSNRPHTDREEDVLEIRRQTKEKLRRNMQLEEEKRFNSMKEKERIEKQEKERRMLMQKEREEQERRRKEQEEEKQRKEQEEEKQRKEIEREESERILRERHALEEARKEEERLGASKKLETSETEESYQIVERGDPEVTTETYVDELGRTVTRTVKKTKIKTTTNINRNTIERTEDEFNRNSISRLQGFGSKSFYDDEDDDILIRAILTVTGFNANFKVLQDMNALSMSSV